MSHKRPVSTGRDGESAAAGEAGIKKAPSMVYHQGGVNPAAPYSPGPGGQVPSAKGGLTSVFGMGTGMTLSREPLKQTLGEERKKQLRMLKQMGPGCSRGDEPDR